MSITNTQHETLNDQVKQRSGETGAGERTYDLEERLVEFASLIIRLVEALPETRAGSHVAAQLLRSGTSPAAHYGEAQAAESRRDFVHKMKVCLKELRETRIWLRIIQNRRLTPRADDLAVALSETDQLGAIFFRSIETARRNETERRQNGAHGRR